MIYLDNSATTKPHPDVLKSYVQASEQFFANPSSIHQLGGQAERLLLRARQQAADILHVHEDEIIFTSGGTEGNNMAIMGVAMQHQRRGKHIITSEIEHPSVYDACKGLEQLGFEITVLPVDANGQVSVEEVKKSIRNDTILISIMHVNNEIGSIQPIQEIAEIAATHPKLFFHVDAVQGLGKISLNLHHPGIDICTLSGHKIHGVRGTGMVYVARSTKLFPLLQGGGQEYGRRSGTENLAGSVSMVKALRLMMDREKTDLEHLRMLYQQLRTKLEQIDGVMINSPIDGAPHILNCSIPGLKPEVVIHALGKRDIYISTKSACSSKQSDISRVLAACGYSRERASSGLRISLSYDTTTEEITTFIEALKEVIQHLKEILE